MTTLTPQQQHDVSAIWTNKWFVLANAVAIYGTDNVIAAVAAIDNAFDTTLNQGVSQGLGAQTLIQALNSVIPAPFSGATNQQKAELVCFTISKRFGLI